MEKLFDFDNLMGYRLGPTADFTIFDLIEGQAKINEVLHEISLKSASGDIFDIDITKFVKGGYPAVYSTGVNRSIPKLSWIK